jgi:hypothetical protein
MTTVALARSIARKISQDLCLVTTLDTSGAGDGAYVIGLPDDDAILVRVDAKPMATVGTPKAVQDIATACWLASLAV